MLNVRFLIVVSFAVSAIQADLISRIEVRTADCDDCGMSNTFGALRMQVSNVLNISVGNIQTVKTQSHGVRRSLNVFYLL